MPDLERKQQQVDELADRISRATVTVLADYRGLSVVEMGRLRARLREADAEFKVAKNTLTRRAAERLGHDELVPYLVGPVGLAFGYGEPPVLARALGDYARVSRILEVRGALLGTRVLPADAVGRLADLPSRDVMLARVVGGIQAPLTGLVTVLNGTLRSFLGVLEARRLQLEESGQGAAPAPAASAATTAQAPAEPATEAQSAAAVAEPEAEASAAEDFAAAQATDEADRPGPEATSQSGA